MKKLILGLSATAILFSGCGKNTTSNTDQPVYNLSGPCIAGYTYGSDGRCYPSSNVVGSSTGFYADNYSNTSSLRVVNGPLMKTFFKQAMGVCDRAAYNYGQASCDSYLAGQMDVIIQFPNAQSNSLIATFIAQPQVNPYANYQATLPSGMGLLGIALGYATGIYLPDPQQYNGAYKNPLQLNMAVSAINNSTGFEGRGYGDYWTGANTTLLAIQIPTGKTDDQNLNFNFNIQGQTAAQGTFSRCRTLNCNLPF
jgi:hypothetical protein